MNFQATQPDFEILTGFSFVREIDPPLIPPTGATAHTQVIETSQIPSEPPPSPQSWGNRTVQSPPELGNQTVQSPPELGNRTVQSPPELGDLGGAEDLRVHNREGAGGEVKRYRLHDLLRRLDDEREEPTTRRAHEVLEPYCRQKQDIPEAIYHANRLDWQRGVAEWVETFDRALELSQYDSCRALLELREVLYVGSYFRWGLIFQSEGDYYAQLAQHQAAEREYLEAIAAYSRALELAPDYINAHNNRGNALQSLGDLQASLSQTDSALASYQNAIAAYSRALSLAPNYVYALNNFGLVLIKLRQLLLENSQEAEAAECLKRTLEAFNRSLEIAPGNDYIRNLRDQLSR